MPPVRTAPTHKLAQRTERSHEENQERAYIAASRRSDRSLEARVESARRASEIHKKRTGRALRVREEDVLNEEMYEEEDDELSQQMRRMSALHPGFTSFSDRLNSYMAGHMGIRSALQQAIIQANKYSAQQLLNPMMQANGVSSPQSTGDNQFNSVPQSPWSFSHLQNGRMNFNHGRSASIATPQELSNFQHSPANTSERRTSLPGQNLRPHGLQSPSLSHPDSAVSSGPSSPHDTYTYKPSKSPLQVPTPPQSNQHQSEFGRKSGLDSAMTRPAHSPSINSQIAPLTTQISAETQQLLHGSQQTFNQDFFPDQLPSGYDFSYSNSLNSLSSAKPRHDNGYTANKTGTTNGLNQTLSPPTIDSKYSTTLPESFSPAYSGSDMHSVANQDPFHDLGVVPGSDSAFNYDQIVFGNGSDPTNYNNYPGMGGEPTWNPDDFLNFGASE